MSNPPATIAPTARAGDRGQGPRPSAGDPDAWLAYAKELESRKHYTLDHAYWISVILERAARFVTYLRSGSWDMEIVMHPEAVGDPFFSIIQFFIDAMRSHEILAPRLKDVLIDAITTCYTELGQHENLEKPAAALCKDFKRLVEACEHADDGRLARIHLAFVEQSFMRKSRLFFDTIFRHKLPPCKTKKEAWASYVEHWLSALSSDDEVGFDNVVVSNAHQESFLCHDFSIGISPDGMSSVELTIPYSGLVAQILGAAVFFRRWRGKRVVIGSDGLTDHPSRDIDRVKGLDAALVGLTEAAHAIESASPYYRGETRQRPRLPLSVQVSPRANPMLPDLSGLMSARSPVMTIKDYYRAVASMELATTAYFGALEKCAKTDYLKMLTLEARDKFHVLFNCFSCWYLFPTDDERRAEFAEEVKRQFYALGEKMEDLAGGFAEFEEEREKKKLLAPEGEGRGLCLKLPDGADPYANAEDAKAFLKGIVEMILADKTLTWKNRPIDCFKNAFDYIWAGTDKSKRGDLIGIFKQVTTFHNWNTYSTVYQKLKNVGSMTQTEKGLKREAAKRRTERRVSDDLPMMTAVDPDTIPGNSR